MKPPGETAVVGELRCPECGLPMRRDRRILVEGHTPFRCGNGHLAVDDAELVQGPECGYMPIPARDA